MTNNSALNQGLTPPKSHPKIHRPNQFLRLAVDLTGTGATKISRTSSGQHVLGTQPTVKPFSVRVLLEQVQLAQKAAFDFVVIEDSFMLNTSNPQSVQGQVDAALITARIAPVSGGIGLIPAVNTTHTEPFHVSKLIATLDHVSAGHGGWEPTVSTTEYEAKLFGRKPAQSRATVWAQAHEVIDVSKKLWDSWEDDAEIRDVPSGRFIDRDKLHYVDYEGVHFSVKGPSITPRPPQGHPVTALSVPAADQVDQDVIDQIIDIAAQHADIVRLNVTTISEAVVLRSAIKSQAQDYGRSSDEVLVYVNLLAITADDALSAQIRKDFLDTSSGHGAGGGSLVFAGTPQELAQLGQRWLAAGAADGLVIKPGSFSADLQAITAKTVPFLASQGIVATSYRGATLRENLGLTRPANQYATAAVHA